MEYAKDILRRASESLNRNASTIQVRLLGVGLLFLSLDERDFRDMDLRIEYLSIKAELSAFRGQIDAATRAMDEETARHLADRIHKLCRILEDRG
jgi:hypothetical protein